MLRKKERREVDLGRISKLLGRSNRFPWELIPARVVMADALPYSQSRLINLGSSRGVWPGAKVTERIVLTDRVKAIMPGNLGVITSSALIGQVVESTAYTARVRLVTDSGFKLNARIIRDVKLDRPAIMPNNRTLSTDPAVIRRPVDVEIQGNGSDGMVIHNVKQKLHQIVPGDRVVTRDDDFFMPAQVPVGVVTKVRNSDTPGFVTLEVAPAASLGMLRNVYVVLVLPDQEIP